MAVGVLGKKYVAALVKSGDAKQLFKEGDIRHLFKANESDLFEFVLEHAKKYQALPDESTIEKHTGVELPESEEPAGYYLDLLKSRHVELSLKKGMQDAAEFLKPDNKAPQEALAKITDVVMQLSVQKQSHQLVDFREALGPIMLAYKEQWHGTEGGVNMGWPTVDGMTGGLVAGDVVSMVGRPAMGKAQPLTARVLLVDGTFKAMGDMQIGDKLASVDGEPSEVFGVYPQGVRPVYRFTFGDGRVVEADEDHLWKVECKYWDAPRVMTTAEILRFRNKAKRYSDALWVEMFSGTFGGKKPSVDPYTLGAWLGDGGWCQHTPTICSMDREILARIEASLPAGHWLSEQVSPKKSPAKTYTVSSSFGLSTYHGNDIARALRGLGLGGLKSPEKFVPNECFLWSRADRVALLQGLMDTDGTVDKNGTLVFGSSSPMLTNGVIDLVRSIGGKATAQAVKQTTHLPHFRATLILADPREAVFLPRKLGRCREHTTHDPRRLRIRRVDYVGEVPCQCIAVTHRSRLYLTDGYTVTHNSWQMFFGAPHAWEAQGIVPMFVSMEMNTLVCQQRLAAMNAHVPMTKLKTGGLTTKGLGKLKAALSGVAKKDKPFWIVDGNLTATVEDVWMLAEQLKPGVIYIDGAYLLKHPRERDRFKRVAENADLIKTTLAKERPVVCSWQFAREAAKKAKKKNENVGLEDIGYTDAIGQVSSLVMGLFEEESVETLQSRRIEILKGRNGEVGSFSTRWDFVKMDFQEIAEENLEDLQFV